MLGRLVAILTFRRRTDCLTGAAKVMQTRYGRGASIPTTDGAEIEALAGSNPSFAAWEQNEPYTIALLIKGRSGGASTKHLYRSGITPCSLRAAPRRTCVTRLVAAVPSPSRRRSRS
jgi:hypothetical protein